MQCLRRSALVLAMLCCALPAKAELIGNASLGLIEFELVDLAPSDGIAPSIQWTGVTSVNINDGDPVGSVVESGATFTELGTVPASYSRTKANFGGLETGLDGEPPLAFLFAAYLSEDGISNFILSAHTRLIARALASVSAQTDEGCLDASDSATCAFVAASAYLSVEGPAANGDPAADLQFQQSLIDVLVLNAGADDRLDVPLEVTFDNLTDGAMQGHFNAVAQIDAAIPGDDEGEVPMPGTAALLAALGVAFTGQRRLHRRLRS